MLIILALVLQVVKILREIPGIFLNCFHKKKNTLTVVIKV